MASAQLSTGRTARGDDLSERMLTFAVRVYKLSKALPRDPFAKHVALQVFRSGTSAGANYEEARGAESREDFVHKMKVVLKELKETSFWVRFVHRAELVKPHLVEPLLNEVEELCRIVGKSVSTARRRSQTPD